MNQQVGPGKTIDNHSSDRPKENSEVTVSFLKDLFTSFENPDTNPNRIARWKEIGWEVFDRKAVLLAATRDLEQKSRRCREIGGHRHFRRKGAAVPDVASPVALCFGAFNSVAAMLVLLGGAHFCLHVRSAPAFERRLERT
jgi:hypothetical protein